MANDSLRRIFNRDNPIIGAAEGDALKDLLDTLLREKMGREPKALDRR
jgi:hypothetical protein